jgi:hypothetical protein
MNGYNQIVTQEDLDALVEHAAGFHDSMLREAVLANRAWVNRDRSMAMSHAYDLRCLVQTQWAPGAVELLFLGVSSLTISGPGEFWEASGTVHPGRIELNRPPSIEIRFDTGVTVTAHELWVRDRTAWLGPSPQLASEVPTAGMIPATQLEHGWFQCSRCADAWRVPPGHTYWRCPSCLAITELQFTLQEPPVREKGLGPDAAPHSSNNASTYPRRSAPQTPSEPPDPKDK